MTDDRRDETAPAPASRVGEVAWTFLRLGCTSFGGPIAHLGYFHTELVLRRAWIDDASYADLVALCQLLPGPASSQVVFALGMRRAGLLGALAASVCFTAPSVALMIAFAYGVARVGDVARAGWFHGLQLAAVAVVAQAVWAMGRKLTPDEPRLSLAVVAAAVSVLVPGALTQVAVIAGGMLVGALALPADAEAQRVQAPSRRARAAGLVALAVFGALLVLLPWLARGGGRAAVFDAFYRSGSLVFGGGHVVLPLLRAEVVPPGWVADDRFLAGYGAAQALPGPMFAFAAYLGAAMKPGGPSWTSGLFATFAIFLPAWLLVGGALPFWSALRARPLARAAFAGANAAVVGVLLAALYRPIVTEAVRGVGDLAAAAVALALLERWKAPPWLVVGLLALVGGFL